MGTAIVQGASLVALRSIYDRQKAVYDKEFDDKQSKASDAYIADLDSLLRYMTREGDDFGLRPVKAEIARFKIEQSVPEDSPPGTPALLAKARARYYEAIEKAEAHRSEQVQALTDKYVVSLKAQREVHLRNSANATAAGFADEIARVSSDVEDAESLAKAEIRLPGRLLDGLTLAYTFDDVSGRRVPDLSGNRGHGRIMGAETRKDPNEGGVCEFIDGYDFIELEGEARGQVSTISVRARFPLPKSARERVLVCGGFGKNHIVVDSRGVLGMGVGGFVPSTFNVGTLKGWHDLTVVSGRNRSIFCIDGKPVAAVDVACHEPVKVVGNSEAGGRPWGGAISSVMVWSRPFSTAEVEALVKILRKSE